MRTTTILSIGLTALILSTLAGCEIPVDEDVFADELDTLELADSTTGGYSGVLAWGDEVHGVLDKQIPFRMWTLEQGECPDGQLDLRGARGEDTFLHLYQWDQGTWEWVAGNDDCTSETLRSCIEYPFEAGEDYVALATTWNYLAYHQIEIAVVYLGLTCPGGVN